MSAARRKRRELERRAEKTRRKLFASPKISKRCRDLSELIESEWSESRSEMGEEARLVAAFMRAISERLCGISRLMEFDDNVNSEIIARSLYDHVVTLAWLSISPEANRTAFVSGVERSELVAAEELRGFDFNLLESLDDEGLQAEKASRQSLPNLKERARLADLCWAEELKLKNGLDFSGFYSHFYRMLSRSREHAGSAVLKSAFSDESRPHDRTRNFWLGIVPALAYYAINIANHTDQRIDPKEAEAAVDFPRSAAEQHQIG